MLQNCLYFNPYFRFRSDQLLEMEAFTDLPSRKPEGEGLKLRHPIDEIDAFDYDLCSSERFSLVECIRILEEEVRKSK